MKIYHWQQERRVAVATIEDPESQDTLLLIGILAGLGIPGGLLYLIDSLVNLIFGLAGLISWLFLHPWTKRVEEYLGSSSGAPIPRANWRETATT